MRAVLLGASNNTIKGGDTPENDNFINLSLGGLGRKKQKMKTKNKSREKGDIE